jgi:hypothetical protein
MFARIRVAVQLAALLATLLSVTDARAAQLSGPIFDMGQILPTSRAVEHAADHARALHCRTPDCVALMTIDDAFEVISDSNATTMGITRPLPIARPARIKRLFRVRLLSHPERFAAICARSADLASRFGAGDDPDPDLFLSTSIILIAYLMDSTGHGQCLPTVLSAFPYLPPSDVAISNAHQLCSTSHWANASCDAIAR